MMPGPRINIPADSRYGFTMRWLLFALTSLALAVGGRAP